MIASYEFHPACLLMPLMQADEFSSLRQSVLQGFSYRHPILLCDGMILDGRHRYQACLDENIEPIFVQWEGGDPYGFVWTEHSARRSWKSGEQKTLTYDAIIEASEVWQATRTQIEEVANLARSVAAKEQIAQQPRDESGKVTSRVPAPPEPGPGLEEQRDHSNEESRRSRTAKAKLLGVSRAAVERSQYLKSHAPELMDKVKEGKMPARTAVKKVQQTLRDENVAQAAALVPDCGDRYQLIHGKCIDALALAKDSVDWIITDPPYPKEFLPVYDELGQVAAQVLKPGGLAIVMIGQSYLPEIMVTLGKYLTYHWFLAYLTPGGQATQIFPRKVNTFWKPVLVFSKGKYTGDWFGDVTKSSVNDNDKNHHHWGQSHSGMKDLMNRFVKPGDTVLDPFLGGGTTAVVALELGASFVGYDIDNGAVLSTKARIGEINATPVS